MTNSPIALSCLCGNVGLTVSSQPNFLHQCNCTLCTKTGAQWAYFPPESVSCEGNTQPFCRADKDDPGAEIHFCGKCGCTTHFVLTKSAIAQHGNTMMGVNFALAAPADLEGVELRFPDGRGWSGEGAFGYYQQAITLPPV